MEWNGTALMSYGEDVVVERCGARQTCGGSQSGKRGEKMNRTEKRRLTCVGGLRETERRRHVFGVAVRKDLVEKGDGIQSGDEWIEM